MKKHRIRFSLIAFVVLVACTLALLIEYKRGHSPSPSKQLPAPNTTSGLPEKGASQTQSGLDQRPNNQNTSEVIAKNQNATNTAEQLQTQIETSVKSMNDTIAFWGRVVDQDGQPVSGARVSLNYRTWHAGASDVNGVVTEASLATDQAGGFELTGVSGDRLTIENVEKSGYILSSKDKKTFAYAAAPELYSPNINSPYLVHMWKQVEHEPTISRKDFYGFQPDGRTYSIDLFTGKNIEGAQGKDDLQVRISRPQDIHPREKFVWSIELAIPNGGIVATSDEFLYQAPENGYSPSIKIEMDPKDPDWTSVLRKSFYIQTRGGATCGAVQMTIRPVYNDKSAIEFQSVLNPAGSRNLQP